jgi:apolipoprotein D and lipocalin family protein
VEQYYASSEEELSYDCMRASLSVYADRLGLEVQMNFSYAFLGDPEHHLLLGNITWVLPDVRQSAHWQHAEDTCKFIRVFWQGSLV